MRASIDFPYPLGNILGGGAHAGPGTPDIQEILVCATGAKTVRDAIETNFATLSPPTMPTGCSMYRNSARLVGYD